MNATIRALTWEALWRRLGAVGDARVVLAEIERQYGEASRHYHTLTHLDACLDVFEMVRSLCERPDEAELALWLHDLVWKPLATDNEVRSAAWARACCALAGLAPEVGERVATMIMATRHDESPVTGDAAVVAERLRALVADSVHDLEGTKATVTVSIGHATWQPGTTMTGEDLIVAADRALYAAKRAGRNRVCGATAPTMPRRSSSRSDR
jgi:predicted metal-dependent HD superfamily phosphohydrolase